MTPHQAVPLIAFVSHHSSLKSNKQANAKKKGTFILDITQDLN